MIADQALLGGMAAPATLVSWRSHRVKRVVASASAAEAMVLSKAIAQGDWIRALWSEVVLGLSLCEWREQEKVPSLISITNSKGNHDQSLTWPLSKKTYTDQECSCAGRMERLKWQTP